MAITTNTDHVIVQEQTKSSITVAEVTDVLYVTETIDGVYVAIGVPANPVVADTPDIVYVDEVTDVIKEISDTTSIYQNIVYNLEPEDEMPLDKRIDFVGDTIIYKGLAEPNSLETDNVWKIQKIEFVGADEDVVINYAGTGLFSHKWTDRESLSY